MALYLPKGKKLEDSLIHLYEEYEVGVMIIPESLVYEPSGFTAILVTTQMSTTMEEAAVKEPRRTSRIGAFIRDNAKQHFIFVEEDIFCEAPNLTAALILWFCIHYVFDLEYSKAIKELGFLFQDVVFSYPDQVKRPATYLAITGDIKCFSQCQCG